MKNFFVFILACGMILSCASVVFADGFVVNACIASEPETIDPGTKSTVDASNYVQHMFENLMKYAITDEPADGSGNVRMTELTFGQAESYEISADLMTYTFTLRDDIYWSDGQPVTANDFVYSWRRLVDPATASKHGYFLNHIVTNAAAIQAGELPKEELGIVALDDKTLQITLEVPCAYFLEICVYASLMPLREDIVENNPNWTDPSTIVVNGPYILSEWVHDSYLKMVKNEKYYDYANLGPDAIVWWLSDSQTAILSAYQSGEYQFVVNYPADMIPSLRASGDAWFDPYIGTYYLYLNTSVITDWRVRAAMALSLDRENIVENVTQGGQVPATGLVASGILDSAGTDFAFGSSELGALYSRLQEAYPDYDLSDYEDRCALAQELYQEAVDEGAWDSNVTLVFNYNTSETHKAIAEACSHDWQDILGMKITLENQEWATYINGLAEHKFGVARLGWLADYSDPTTYLELMTTGNSYNYALYNNADYDSAIATAKGMLAGEERDALLYSAEETLFSEGGFPVAPVYYYTNTYLNKTVKNIGYTPLGYYFMQYAQPVD